MKKFILTAFSALLGLAAFAQVTIVVPTATDTVICNGAPLTLQAQNRGYIPHTATFPYSTDDGYSPLYPIGFSFNYYGVAYTSFVISSNGYITFNSSSASSYSAYSLTVGIPGNVNCQNSVLGSYSDLLVSSPAVVTYGLSGVAPNRKLVVNFCNCSHFSCTTLKTNMQIILYETTNVAEVHIQHKDACGSWNGGAAIEGVEKNGAAVATAAPGRNYPTLWTVTTPDARRFTPNPSLTAYTCDTIAYNPIPDSNAVINWYNGSTFLATGPTVVVNPTVPTTYQAYAVSCKDTSRDFVNVVIGTGPSITGSTITNPSICGACDGRIVLHGLVPGSSDTINYQYNGVPQTTVVAVPDAAGDVTLNGLCAGVYNNFFVKVGYCTSPAYGPVTLTNPSFTISSTGNTSPSVCGMCDGTITLYGLVAGTSDTINYIKNGVPQPTVIQVVSAAGTVTLTGLCAGTYTGITAKMNDCITPAVGPVYVIDPSFTISSVTHIDPTVCGICDGSITINGLVAGFYDTVNFTRDGIPQPAVVLLVPASGSIVLTNMCAGVYTGITVKMNTCTATGANTTLVNPSFTIASTSHTNPSVCGACDATITINGLIPGYIDTVNFVKDGVPQAPVILTVPASGTIVLTGLCAGDYTNLTVKMNSCITPAAPMITLVNPAFGISGFNWTNATCSACDGTFTLTGLTPGQTITVNYSFNGNPQPPFVTTSSSTGTVTLVNLCPGTYTNITAKLNTCVSNPVGPIVISAPPLIPISIQGFTQPTECGLCNGTITIKGAPPGPIDTVFYNFNGIPSSVLYSASPDSLIIMYNLCEGNYSNFFIKVGPCPTTTIGTNVALDAPPITPLFDTFIVRGCNGDVAYFNNMSTSTGPLWYVWDFGDGTTDTTANPVHTYLNQGTYTVTLTITNHHCDSTATKVLVLVHPVQAIFSSDTLVCQKSNVAFTNTSIGATYLWSFGDGGTSTSATPSYAYNNVGTYTVSLIATNGIPCSDTAYEVIHVDSLSPINVTVTDTVFCQATYVTLTSNYSHVGNTGNIWYFGNGDSIANVNPVIYAYPAPGTFTITSIVDFRICPSISATRIVTVLPQPQINLGPDTTICEGSAPIELIDGINAGNASATWIWNTGATSFNIFVGSPGGYRATVSIGNCHATDSVTISQDCFVAMPNIFTPNGDGVNDYFYPRSLLSSGLTEFKMDIYNRWGALIFETNAVEGQGWDGKYNGVAQPEEVYIYVIDAKFKDGKKEHHTGNITLIR